MPEKSKRRNTPNSFYEIEWFENEKQAVLSSQSKERQMLESDNRIKQDVPCEAKVIWSRQYQVQGPKME